MLRGLFGHVALVAFLEAIERLPLAVASLLGKIHPLAAAVFAWMFLGEPLPRSRVMAILASAGGIALIANPSPGELVSGDPLGIALALFAGTLSGAAYCCVRAVAQAGEDETWTLLSLPLFSIPFCAHDAWKGIQASHTRDMKLLGLFFLMGVSTQIGQVFLARGLRVLPAASATQVMYIGVVLSALLGVLLGDPWPNWRVWVGGVIICASLRLAESPTASPKTLPTTHRH